LLFACEALEEFDDEGKIVVTTPDVFHAPTTADLLLLRNLQLQLSNAVRVVRVLKLNSF
jgi:hypothetical protein